MTHEIESYPMWSYWRDKKGTIEAVKDYFPEVLKENDELARAVAQAETALRSIDQIMRELEV